MSDAYRFDTEALKNRLSAFGGALAEREAGEAAGRTDAQARAGCLRELVADGVAEFNRAAAAGGAPHLAAGVSEIRPDDKHVRSVQFDILRGHYTAIVTVKSRGEVTLVGPFRAGKTQGPCLSFPFGNESELEKALGDFLEKFLAEAATP